MKNQDLIKYQIAAIVDTINEIKLIQSSSTEIMGSEKLSLLIDAKNRLNALMLTLNWNQLQQLTRKVA